MLHHAVATRASKPATEATKRSRLRGKRTSRGQRSWRHETAAGGGNPLRGMKRATRTRNSRDPLHTDQQWPGWGAGSTRMTTRNVANPRIGSGMQQARESCASNGAKLCASRAIGGESRRDRENRCGRNGIARLAPRDRSGGSNVVVGVDAGDEVDGGARRSGSREPLRQRCRRWGAQPGRIPRELIGNHRSGHWKPELWRGAKLTRAGADRA